MRPLALVGLALTCVCLLVLAVCESPPVGIEYLLGASLLGMGFQVGDANLTVTKALPNGAASIVSDGIDLGHGSNGDFLANCELLIDAPALVVGDLPDTETMTYIVEHDDDSAFGSVATLVDNAIVQTGAGGAGADAAEVRVRLPVDVKRYVRVKATNSGAGDASDKSLTAQLLF